MVSSAPSGLRPPERSLDPRAWALVALLAALAFAKLSNGFERLLVWDEGGAVDLHLRFDETRAWFAGYWIKGAVYPPASQALLWPAVGWLSFEEVRGLWALLSLGCLGWFSWICARDCGLRSALGKVACALLPLALSATSSAVGIGQIVPLFLPLVVTAALRMARGPSHWVDSAGVAVLFTLASVKPTLFAPFAWLVLLLPRSPRPAVLSGALYVSLTLLALAALRTPNPDAGIAEVIETAVDNRMQWATSGEAWAQRPPEQKSRMPFDGGYGNLQNMSWDAGLVGLQNFVLPVVSVLACGAWLFFHRRTDPWILLGVCALAARLGWYHRIYDDMLLSLPVIALVRIVASRGAPGGADRRTFRIAAILLAATVAHLLSPGSAAAVLQHVPRTLAPWIWLADLFFLAGLAPGFDPLGSDADRETGFPASAGAA